MSPQPPECSVCSGTPPPEPGSQLKAFVRYLERHTDSFDPVMLRLERDRGVRAMPEDMLDELTRDFLAHQAGAPAGASLLDGFPLEGGAQGLDVLRFPTRSREQ